MTKAELLAAARVAAVWPAHHGRWWLYSSRGGCRVYDLERAAERLAADPSLAEYG